MPPLRTVRCALSFGVTNVLNRFREPNIGSYKDWFVHYYGHSLYEVMCRPYTSKIWRTDPANLSADWAEQRFQGESLQKLVRRVFEKLATLDFSSYSLEDESLAPDGGEFYYPERGIQELPNAFARAVARHGGRMECGARVLSVSRKEKTVSYEWSGETRAVKYDHLISTIPLHAFYRLCGERDPAVDEALSRTKYMNILFVFVFLNKEHVSNDHWLYFPDKDIVFNRAVEFGNWSPYMCPKGKTSVCLDVTYFDGEETASIPDDVIAERVIGDAVRVGYLHREDVMSHLVFRLKNAYPFYDLNYKQNLSVIVGHLEQHDVHLLGRSGIFRYNNSDNSIEMAFELANNFTRERSDKSVFNYTIKQVSY
jgi:protoporphyrinogen oxidase